MSDYRNSGVSGMPRGLLDNNPGDLTPPPSGAWNGQVGLDGPFCIFSDTVFGLRALAMDIANNITVDGNNTITLLITKYAPPAQNNTAAYISSVAGDTGLNPSAAIPQTQAVLASLMRAIINEELGDSWSSQYVPDTDIAAGIAAMPAPLLSAFVNGPTMIDQNSGAFGFILLGVIFGAAYLVK
jgi:hypothetical protein